MNETVDIITLTDENFKNVILQNKKPVLVLFETEWFGSTHILMPIMRYLAKKYKGKLKVGKFNLDTNELIPKKYGISDTITILLFKNGELKSQFLGMVDRETLEDEVVTLL